MGRIATVSYLAKTSFDAASGMMGSSIDSGASRWGLRTQDCRPMSNLAPHCTPRKGKPMHTLSLGRLIALGVLISGFAAGTIQAAASENLPIEEFYGIYEGKALDTAGEQLEGRDLSVQIEEGKKRGFKLTWTTVIQRKDGRVSRKSHSVTFNTTASDNVYASAMRTNVFGKAIPLDPLKGDPYVWATLRGATLTVNALVITDEHGYEMQTYRRTRTKTGLELVFHRVRDGKRLKDIRGELVKVD